MTMQAKRQLPLLVLVASLVALSQLSSAQQVIATVPTGPGPGLVGVNPATNKIYVVNNLCNDNQTCQPATVTVIDGATENTVSVPVGIAGVGFPAVNSVTNKIYVSNGCGNDPNCVSPGTVSIIDGATNVVTATVGVGFYPGLMVVNPLTNKIYVVNNCGNDVNCQSPGSVTVINGVNNSVLATIPVGGNPEGIALNQGTNTIYVVNVCGGDPSCSGSAGTVSVIDGSRDTVVGSFAVGYSPFFVAVNQVTGKVYVANGCGDDPTCASQGTATVIKAGGPQTIPLGGYEPFGLSVNPVTNEIYAVNSCGASLPCGSSAGSVTVIDGSSDTVEPSSPVNVGLFPYFAEVDAVTNKVYVANAFCNKLTRHTGLTCSSGPGTVTMIDGLTKNTVVVHAGIGDGPFFLAANSVTNKVYVPSYADNNVAVIAGAPSSPAQFVALPPCRLYDSRPAHGGSGPLQGGTTGTGDIRQFSQKAGCGDLSTAVAYSLNITVVPHGRLGYLTLWPTGEDQPVVSTLNSVDGRVKANAVIIPGGYMGAINAYVTDTTDIIVDIDGYFAPVSTQTLAFYPLTPCRVVDTRKDTYPSGLGPPALVAGVPRSFPILESTSCIPPGTNPVAYSFNFTVVPINQHPVGYLSAWPTGQSQPVVSTLNDQTGTIVANAAIVPAGTDSERSVSVFSTDGTQLLIDINGYFAAAGTGGLSLYPAAPCRALDTRRIGTGQPFTGSLSPPLNVVGGPCGPPSTARAYVFNATVVPVGPLGYLALWPDGETQPVVSTLNAVDGAITNNMAIVPTNNGSIDAYAGNGLTQLLLDISSYFAP
jgi:YVTN family beta-propeller protein